MRNALLAALLLAPTLSLAAPKAASLPAVTPAQAAALKARVASVARLSGDAGRVAAALQGLDPADAAQLKLFAPLARAYADIGELDSPNALVLRALEIVDGAAHDAVRDAQSHEAPLEALEANAAALKDSIALAGLYRPAALNALTAAYSETSERLTARRSQRAQAFADAAIDLMRDHGRDLGPSLDNLRAFSNEHQLAGLEALLSGDDYTIYNKLDAVLKFDNRHQAAALRAMTAHGRDVSPSMDALARISNRHQVSGIRALLSGDNYQIYDKLPAILKFANRRQPEALYLMAAHGRLVRPSMDAISRISNKHQVAAMKALLEATHAEGGTYEVAPKMESVLGFKTAAQTKALQSLLDRGLGVKGLMPALAQADTPEKAALLEDYARSVRAPRWDTERIRTAWTGFLLAVLGLAATLSSSPMLAAVFAAAAVAGLVWWRLALRAARAVYARDQASNRAWLDARPEIEKTLGALEADELGPVPAATIAARFKTKTVVDAGGVKIEASVTAEEIEKRLAELGLRIRSVDADGLHHLRAIGSDGGAALAALASDPLTLHAAPENLFMPVSRRVDVKFRETIALDLGGLGVEASVSEDDIAAFLREHKLTVLERGADGVYKLGVEEGRLGADAVKKLAAEKLVASARLPQEELDAMLRAKFDLERALIQPY